MPAYPLFVAGRRVMTRRTRAVVNPYTGRAAATQSLASPKEVEAALSAARDAFGKTAALPAHARSGVLAALADGIAARKGEFVRRIVAEAGKPVKHAAMEVDRAVFTFRLAAGEALRIGGELLPTDIAPRGEGYVTLVQRVPVGPVLAITPFNFPLNLAAHKIAPALAAGCPVLLKPPPQAPGCAVLLAEILERTAWPVGGFQVLSCENDVAGTLVTDDRLTMLSFTGSAAVGWRLKGIAGRKRVTLELGGNAGMMVEPDCDLDVAATRAAAGAFAYAGQVCISVQRVLVNRKVHAPFLKRFLAAVRNVKSGDPRDPAVDNGPLIDDAAAGRVLAWIGEARRSGARILSGGKRLAGHRNVIAPTVIALADSDPRLKVECEEAFGPVVTVFPYRTFEAGLARLGATRYGLQAGLFTNDLRKVDAANRALRVGGLIVNDAPTFRMDNAPYGGTNESGLGREGVRAAIGEMTEPKLLVIRTGR